MFSALLLALRIRNLPARHARALGSDVDLSDAIFYVAYRKWSRTIAVAAESASIPKLAAARNDVMRRARDGSLPIWGRLRSDERTELIPADFWWRFEVSFFELVAGARTLRSQPAPGNRWASEFLYKDLATCSATVEMLWPDLRGQWQLSLRTR